jgi:hypothetical protein
LWGKHFGLKKKKIDFSFVAKLFAPTPLKNFEEGKMREFFVQFQRNKGQLALLRFIGAVWGRFNKTILWKTTKSGQHPKLLRCSL